MKAMSKHTPGPWAMSLGEVCFEVEAENWKTIAIVGPGGHVDDEDEANARLIASAPELLAALEQISEYPLNVTDYDGTAAIQLRFVVMQTIARDAIKKVANTAINRELGE